MSGERRRNIDLDSTEFDGLSTNLHTYISAMELLWDELVMFAGEWQMRQADRDSLSLKMSRCSAAREKLIK